VPIKEVKPHPNADNLLLIEIMGWQVCTHKDTNPQVGELRVFIPPDAVLPQELAEQLDVVKYLKKGNRVGQVKLRQEFSFGIAASNVWDFEVGQEVSEQLGITKYVQPLVPNSGDQEQDHPLFTNYSHIENWRNYPELFVEGEPVVILEKVDGTNSKVGLVYEEGEFIPMIGSHNTRKKMVEQEDDPKGSLYQYPLKKVLKMLNAIAMERAAKIVIVFGEIYGRVQKLRYGRDNALAYLGFDICVDGKMLDWGDAKSYFTEYGVDHAPIVYRGPYNVAMMKDCANQNTLLMPPENAHISEGVIIRPERERVDPSFGRVILKYKSDAYEEMKSRGKVTEFS
jgi:RNA ligase (TIGR02306 family)